MQLCINSLLHLFLNARSIWIWLCVNLLQFPVQWHSDREGQDWQPFRCAVYKCVDKNLMIGVSREMTKAGHRRFLLNWLRFKPSMAGVSYTVSGINTWAPSITYCHSTLKIYCILNKLSGIWRVAISRNSTPPSSGHSLYISFEKVQEHCVAKC